MTRLQSDVAHIRADLDDLKTDVRETPKDIGELPTDLAQLRMELRTDGRELTRGPLQTRTWMRLLCSAMLGIMAHGLHWP